MPAFLRWWCISLQGPQRSTQNYNLKLAFLKNICRAEILGRFCGPFGAKSIKTVHFRGRICKIGGRICPLIIFSMFTRLGIWRRLCMILLSNISQFIHTYDWAMDICAIPNSCWAPKIMIIKWMQHFKNLFWFAFIQFFSVLFVSYFLTALLLHNCSGEKIPFTDHIS